MRSCDLYAAQWGGFWGQISTPHAKFATVGWTKLFVFISIEANIKSVKSSHVIAHQDISSHPIIFERSLHEVVRV